MHGNRTRTAWQRLLFLLSLLFITSVPTACTAPAVDIGVRAVRPVAKIGLIAPFEGLYRRSGYDTLDAVRQAIHDAGMTGAVTVDLLPLALDDSADPARARRAAEKLLASTDVAAIIGPLTPALTHAVAPVLDTGALDDGAQPPIPWIAPHAIDPAGGFAAPDSHAWADGLVAAVGAAARSQGATRLVLAGWSVGWPKYTAAQWSAVASMPVLPADDPGAVAATDAVFWLGDADGGADFVRALRARGNGAPFWLGAAGSDPVFGERAPEVENAYWAAWVNADYNDWADGRVPAAPTAFAVYEATQAAIVGLSDKAAQSVSPWRVDLFALRNDISMPFSFE